MSTTDLVAGRELDALVAEEVMGFHEVMTEYYVASADDAPELDVRVIPCFSTDIAAAWLVVKKLTGNTGSDYDLELTIASSKGGWCTASFLPETKGWGETAPLAICRAALAAVSPPPLR